MDPTVNKRAVNKSTMTASISIRLHQRELDAIKKKAAELNLTAGRYIRRILKSTIQNI